MFNILSKQCASVGNTQPIKKAELKNKICQLSLEQLENRVLLDGTIYTVDSLLDVVEQDGFITLREAIIAANTNQAYYDAPAGNATEIDVIEFDTSLMKKTILLNGNCLQISDSLQITGLGPSDFTIASDGRSRVFKVEDLDTTDEIIPQVFISSLTITGGSTAYSNENGGAIWNNTQLTLDDLVITGNQTGSDGYGGGVYHTGEGQLMITQSDISGNLARYGGAISNRASSNGLLCITDTNINGNTVNTDAYTSSGGAIYNDAKMELISVTLSDNTAYRGGAIYNTAVGQVVILNSSIISNSVVSDGQGGGIYNLGKLNLINSTMAWNSAHNGSGLYHDSSITAQITQSTIAANQSRNIAGGIYVNQSSVMLKNSIIAHNMATVSNPDVKGAFGGEYNLVGIIDGATGLTSEFHNQIGTVEAPLDARLGGVDDQPWMTLLTDSPALDAGNNDLALDHLGNPLPYDQRGVGFDRVQDGVVDLGACEGDISIDFQMKDISGQVKAGAQLPLQWNPGTFPLSSSIRFYYDKDDELNGNEYYFTTDLKANQWNGLYDQWYPTMSAGHYYLGGVVHDETTGDDYYYRMPDPIDLYFDNVYIVNTTEDVVAKDGFLSLREDYGCLRKRSYA